MFGNEAREVFLHDFFHTGIMGSPCENIHDTPSFQGCLGATNVTSNLQNVSVCPENRFGCECRQECNEIRTCNGQGRCSGENGTCICDRGWSGPFCNMSYKCAWWSNGSLSMPVSTLRAGVPVVFGFDIRNPLSKTDEYGSFLQSERASGLGGLQCSPAPNALQGALAASGNNRHCLASTLFCVGSVVELHSLQSSLSFYEGAHAQIVAVIGLQQALEVSLAQKIIMVPAANCRLISRATERDMVGVQTVFDNSLFPQRAGTFRLAFVAAGTSRLPRRCANVSDFVPPTIFSNVFKVLPDQLSFSVSGDLASSFVVGEKLPVIEIALLDTYLAMTEVGEGESLFVSASLFQGSTDLSKNLMGSVEARVRSGVAVFNNLAVEQVIGRGFHLRFFITGGETTVETVSSKFDVMPASLFIPPITFPGDQLLTAGQHYAVSVHFLDQHQEIIDTVSHSASEFSISVRMMKEGRDISEHLDVAATNSSSKHMNLTVHAIAAQVSFEFYISNTTVGITTTPQFHVRPLTMCAQQSAVSYLSTPYIVGMILNPVQVHFCPQDMTKIASSNANQHSKAVPLLDAVSVEAQLHLCLDFFAVQKATARLHGTVLLALESANGSVVFDDLTVAEAGKWRLQFALLINGAYVGVRLSTDEFVARPSVQLDSIAGRPASASSVQGGIEIAVNLDIYGLVRLPSLAFKTSPQHGSSIKFELSASVSVGQFANGSSSTSAIVEQRSAQFLNLRINPEGSSEVLLRVVVVGAGCEAEGLNATGMSACVEIVLQLNAHQPLEPALPRLQGRPRAPLFSRVETAHSSSVVIQDGGMGTAITEVLIKCCGLTTYRALSLARIMPLDGYLNLLLFGKFRWSHNSIVCVCLCFPPLIISQWKQDPT